MLRFSTMALSLSASWEISWFSDLLSALSISTWTQSYSVEGNENFVFRLLGDEAHQLSKITRSNLDARPQFAPLLVSLIGR